ncbi:hypothetical protein ACN079_09580 [Pseudomonas sp. ABY48]|uniref:hypothetical protein n=1 Tax=Pseudomonas sp. ABY48 TaxID=3402865 RepID=UPI003B42E898
MNNLMSHWDEVPLLRAGTCVADTATQLSNEIHCGGFIPRYNVGNIHEIKKLWNAAADESI